MDLERKKVFEIPIFCSAIAINWHEPFRPPPFVGRYGKRRRSGVLHGLRAPPSRLNYYKKMTEKSVRGRPPLYLVTNCRERAGSFPGRNEAELLNNCVPKRELGNKKKRVLIGLNPLPPSQAPAWEGKH